MFGGLDVPLPDLDSIAEEKDEVVPAKDEWAAVLGGASSVGKFAVQVRFFWTHRFRPRINEGS